MILDNSQGEKWERDYASSSSNQMDGGDFVEDDDDSSWSDQRTNEEKRKQTTTIWNLLKNNNSSSSSSSPLALILLFVLSNVQVGASPHDPLITLPAVASLVNLFTQHWLFCIWMGYLAFQLYDFVEKGSNLYYRNLANSFHQCYINYRAGRSNHYEW